MSFIGKLHEISLYGIISFVVNLIRGTTTFSSVHSSGFNPEGFVGIFEAYMYWALVLYIPIAIVCAFYTKFADDGEGLLFTSDNIFVT